MNGSLAIRAPLWFAPENPLSGAARHDQMWGANRRVLSRLLSGGTKTQGRSAMTQGQRWGALLLLSALLLLGLLRGM